METFYIPNECDFKRWVKEAVQEYFQTTTWPNSNKTNDGSEIINRKEVAALLKVSLVTLTDWMKRGLPFYKQRGRVYFIKSEVLEYIQKNGRSKGGLFLNSG
jgi:predicted DNA-binding transcriptional regulator AlpA